MSDNKVQPQKEKNKIKWLEKIKNIKHIEVYVVAIFIIVLLLIFFSTSGTKSSNKLAVNNVNTSSNTQVTITSYVDEMETKLENILSKVQGASDVSVMITLDMSSSSIKDNIVQTNEFPAIKGVIVVAKGVENTHVKMNILKAVQSVIDISNGRIEILSSN